MESSSRPVVFDDDNPEWTDEDFARARPAAEVLPPEVIAAFGKSRGRPAKSEAERKRNVSLRLSPDVLDALRASGPGWQTRAEEMLREGLRRGAGKAA
jgi:uncharacterized protein (DUF4415 family)